LSPTAAATRNWRRRRSGDNPAAAFPAVCRAAAALAAPCHRHRLEPGLAIKNPPKKKAKKTTKNFFWGFFKFLFFYENNTNFSL
jgi:hypothetical protein